MISRKIRGGYRLMKNTVLKTQNFIRFSSKHPTNKELFIKKKYIISSLNISRLYLKILNHPFKVSVSYHRFNVGRVILVYWIEVQARLLIKFLPTQSYFGLHVYQFWGIFLPCTSNLRFKNNSDISLKLIVFGINL